MKAKLTLIQFDGFKEVIIEGVTETVYPSSNREFMGFKTLDKTYVYNSEYLFSYEITHQD